MSNHTFHHGAAGIGDRLKQQYRRCLTSRRHHRIQQRWMDRPGLADRTLEEIATIIARPDDGTTEHNAVVAGLIRAHQDHDSDATTVLLHLGIAPLIHKLPHRNDPETLTHLWAVASCQLATATPDTIETTTRSFLGILHGRLRRDLWRVRRAHDVYWDHHRFFPRYGGHHQRAGSGERVGDDAAALDQLTVDRGHIAADGVEEAALARYQLTTIATHIRNGVVCPDRWNELLAVHVTGAISTPSGGTRSNVSRTTRQVRHLAECA